MLQAAINKAYWKDVFLSTYCYVISSLGQNLLLWLQANQLAIALK
jgi:hypothetical protein